MSVFHFGKHKGEDIEDVPFSYLEWFLENIDPPPASNKPEEQAKRDAFVAFLDEIEEELASREKYRR